MPLNRVAKTSFTSGELAPELLGRGDLRAWDTGARTLRNVTILPTGGLTRRPGLRHVASLPGPARLIGFEFNTEQTYLLAFTANLLTVFRGDVPVATLPGPWSAPMLPQLGFTQSADTLLLVHPDMSPQRITRDSDTSWTLAAWNFQVEPFFRFAEPEVTMAASGTSGSVTLTTSAPVFLPGQLGFRFRFAGGLARLTAIASPTTATATIEAAPLAADATRDWQEAAFSDARGWPVTVCFHQDRLVVGGCRSLPHRLFLSATNRLFDFDTGKGLDDQSIQFSLLADQVNAIRGVFSSHNLQVFTSGAEWMVTGAPLTPSSIQVNRQTRIGSPTDRLIPPVDVDGSTVFCARGGAGVFEFAYTALAQAYQANDLALVAHHLVRAPLAMAYDAGSRLLHLALADGGIATLTIYRSEQVTAWSRQETAGAVTGLAVIEGTAWVAVARLGTTRLERFDASLNTDAALSGTAAQPDATWHGLDHLNGATVAIVADGAPTASQPVLAGAVTLAPAATTVEAGLPYAHVVEPLPYDPITAAGVQATPLRLVSVTFRVLHTASLAVDLGTGPMPVPFRRLDTPLLDAPPPAFTGDVTLRGLGWTRDGLRTPWRIADATPLPMTLLSATTLTRTTDP